MPNHVKNVVKFKNLKSKEDINFILDMIAVPIDKDHLDKYKIDFDKIIPEPRQECDCPDDCKVNKDSHVMEDKERPWFDWYAWHNKYWGTKWNAYDCYTEIGKTHVTFVFNTAWSFALPIITRLSLLSYDIDVKYADEDLGNNCGELHYTNEDGWLFWDETDMHDPKTFARNLWDSY